MTEKQKNIRSLIKTLALMLAVTALFFVFYYAILPLVNHAMIENGSVGTYLYYNRPKTLEDYDEIITKKNKASLSEVEVSYKLTKSFHNNHLNDGGYNMINTYRPQYVACFDGFKDCFVAEYEDYNYNDGNYIVMMCDVLDDDFKLNDVSVCIRTANAPSCEKFKKMISNLKEADITSLSDRYYLEYGSWIEYGWAYWADFQYMYLILSDGVAVIEIRDTWRCIIEGIIPYEDAENVNGVPAKSLIDLFNEHERSEG